MEGSIVGAVHAVQDSPAQIDWKRDTASSWALVDMLSYELGRRESEVCVE